MPISMGPDTVTVVTPADIDWQGDPTGPPTETDVSDCFFQPVTTNEQTGGQDTVRIDARIFMPADTVIQPTSRVRYRGQEYQVHGEPARWHTKALSRFHHIEVDLRRWEG